MPLLHSVKGLVALITGGASGLGKATAERFINQGGKVILFDLPTSKGHEVAAVLGANCIYSPGDVVSETSVKEAVNLAEKHFGKLDVTVNCAAISCAYTTYNFTKDQPHKLEDFEKHLRVSAEGTFNVIRLVCELMGRNEPNEDGQRGVIINTASAVDEQSGQVTHSACSSSIKAMTLPIARDLASQGIRCCTIAPGLFNTPLSQYFSKEVLTFFREATPCPNRFGDPAEFAHLVEFLVQNPLMNGEIIRIDGGLRLALF